ncbi:pyridoxamine 5'-phosphate oxidase family protein [Sphaerisporangium fuscum]|uniref:pyridoxamine 5'-phosphate oxidase family protein n=1 Tax=Sphaerisporangium fuscum TaxID=2835868 RepID=UPI001BDC5083|nr:pyridoxamine 5'-phosphate oxidase family protein [Sphaerisporangium fuscum]
MEHPGELLLQRRAGMTRPLGSARARAEIPPVAAAFLEARNMLVIGARDDRGRVWAGTLTGPEGFATTDGDRSIVVDALPDGPLAGLFGGEPRDIGVIAIEPATRRRMRVNGRARGDGHRLTITTDQVYSNCPKYIQRRVPPPVLGELPRRGPATTARTLTEAQRRWIAMADTFFIATHVAGLGADTSHRGGAPGFVRVTGERRLAWREYPGNFMFMTLGNLELAPACGLLFLDWEHGHGLHLTGRAAYDGGEVEFELDEVVEITAEIPSPWRFVEASPFNPPPLDTTGRPDRS